jgi:hypothetical protein
MHKSLSLSDASAYTPLVADPPKSKTIVKSGGLLRFISKLQKTGRRGVGKKQGRNREETGNFFCQSSLVTSF